MSETPRPDLPEDDDLGPGGEVPPDGDDSILTDNDPAADGQADDSSA